MPPAPASSPASRSTSSRMSAIETSGISSFPYPLNRFSASMNTPTLRCRAADDRATSARAVVGGLDGHLDVVRVTLLEPRRRDAHKPPLLLQLGDRAGADVEHRL